MGVPVRPKDLKSARPRVPIPVPPIPAPVSKDAESGSLNVNSASAPTYSANDPVWWSIGFDPFTAPQTLSPIFQDLYCSIWEPKATTVPEKSQPSVASGVGNRSAIFQSQGFRATAAVFTRIMPGSSLGSGTLCRISSFPFAPWTIAVWVAGR